MILDSWQQIPSEGPSNGEETSLIYSMTHDGSACVPVNKQSSNADAKGATGKTEVDSQWDTCGNEYVLCCTVCFDFAWTAGGGSKRRVRAVTRAGVGVGEPPAVAEP